MKAVKNRSLRLLYCPLMILLLLCSFTGCAEQQNQELYALTDLSYVKEMLQTHQSANEPVTFHFAQQIFYKVDLTEEFTALLDLEHWEEEVPSAEPPSDQFTISLYVKQPNPDVDVYLHIQYEYAEIHAIYNKEHAEPYQESRFYRLPQEKSKQFVEKLNTYLNDHNLITKPQF